MTTTRNYPRIQGIGRALVAMLGLSSACGGESSGPGTDTGATASGTVSTGPGTDASGTASSGGTVQPTGGSDSDGATNASTQGVETGASTTADDTGLKFDLQQEGTTTGGGPLLPGSCRPSEIHGASGGFPAFSDPAYASFLDRSVVVMTSNAQEDGFVLHVVDISGPTPPPNMNYLAPTYHHPSWQGFNLGRIFGLTLDSSGNIYVAPTTVYGANPSPATIKRVDGKTGETTDFATLPNNGPALGNINYDCISQTIYASNHEDGRIYQIDMQGQTVSTYRHLDKTVTLGPAMDPGEPDGQFAPLGARVWAVQSHAGRLYYSVWKEDTGRQSADSNEVWSVAYADEGGVPDPATAKLEFEAPPYLGQAYSNPISDLSFAATGWMLVAQRTMITDNQTSAHQSTTYEYQYNNGTWELKGTTFIIGELPGSCTGGVDHDFAEDGYVWMSGDALDFYTPEVVYGLQGTPHAGGDIMNSTIIDLDHEVTNQDKTAMGDVEVPIPGDAKPVPPPE